MADANTLTLDDLVTRARQHRVTPEEMRAQRVSMVMGLKSHNSSLTRERAEELLGEIEGHDRQTSPSRTVEKTST